MAGADGQAPQQQQEQLLHERLQQVKRRMAERNAAGIFARIPAAPEAEAGLVPVLGASTSRAQEPTPMQKAQAAALATEQLIKALAPDTTQQGPAGETSRKRTPSDPGAGIAGGPLAGPAAAPPPGPEGTDHQTQGHRSRRASADAVMTTTPSAAAAAAAVAVAVKPSSKLTKQQQQATAPGAKKPQQQKGKARQGAQVHSEALEWLGHSFSNLHQLYNAQLIAMRAPGSEGSDARKYEEIDDLCAIQEGLVEAAKGQGSLLDQLPFTWSFGLYLTAPPPGSASKGDGAPAAQGDVDMTDATGAGEGPAAPRRGGARGGAAAGRPLGGEARKQPAAGQAAAGLSGAGGASVRRAERATHQAAAGAAGSSGAKAQQTGAHLQAQQQQRLPVRGSRVEAQVQHDVPLDDEHSAAGDDGQAHVVDGELDRLDAEVEQIVAQLRGQWGRVEEKLRAAGNNLDKQGALASYPEPVWAFPEVLGWLADEQLVRGLARGGLGLCFLSVGVQLLATMLGHTKRPLRALTERDLADIGQSLGEPAAMLLRNVQYVRGDPARADADKGLARQRHLSYLLHLAGVLDPTPQSKHEDTVDIHLALPAEDPSLLDPLGPKVDVEGITNLYKSVRRRAAAFYAGSQQDAASIFELEIMGDREGVVPWSKTTGLPRALHDMMSFSTYYTCTCLGCGYSSAPKQQRQAVLVVGNGLVQSTGVAANQTYTPHFNMRPCPVCRWSFVSPDLPLSVALTEWLPDEEKKLFATWAKQPTEKGDEEKAWRVRAMAEQLGLWQTEGGISVPVPETYVQPKWFEHVTKMKAQAELLKNLHNPKRPVQALHLFSSVQAYPALVEEGLEAAPEFLCLSLRNFRCYQGATRITIDRTITLPVANGTMATYTLAAYVVHTGTPPVLSNASIEVRTRQFQQAGGHYFMVRRVGTRWYLIDDDAVEDLLLDQDGFPAAHMLQHESNVYMVLYQLHNSSG